MAERMCNSSLKDKGKMYNSDKLVFLEEFKLPSPKRKSNSANLSNVVCQKENPEKCESKVSLKSDIHYLLRKMVVKRLQTQKVTKNNRHTFEGNENYLQLQRDLSKFGDNSPIENINLVTMRDIETPFNDSSKHSIMLENNLESL